MEVCKEREFWQCNINSDRESPGDPWMGFWGLSVSIALPAEMHSFAWKKATSIWVLLFCIFFFFYQFSSFLPTKADFLATKSQVWWQKSILIIVTPISPRCLMCLLEKPQKTCLPVHSWCQINIWWISEMCFSMRWYIQKIAMYSFYIEKKKKSSWNHWQSFLFPIITFAVFQGMFLLLLLLFFFLNRLSGRENNSSQCVVHT